MLQPYVRRPDALVGAVEAHGDGGETINTGKISQDALAVSGPALGGAEDDGLVSDSGVFAGVRVEFKGWRANLEWLVDSL